MHEAAHTNPFQGAEMSALPQNISFSGKSEKTYFKALTKRAN